MVIQMTIRSYLLVEEVLRNVEPIDGVRANSLQRMSLFRACANTSV